MNKGVYLENDDGLIDDGNKSRDTYYILNREIPYSIYLDEKENAIDSLETALPFLERKDNLKWKWFALALHHSLYSFCISALEFGNYEQVLSRKQDDDKDNYLQKGNNKPLKSRIVYVYKGKYKTPAYRIEWDEIDSIPPQIAKTKNKIVRKEKLIGFWTSLARIQDEYYWMSRLIITKAVFISDEELYRIFWLSKRVRNDLMHFIPKGYIIRVIDIIESTRIILRIIDDLVFESYSISFVDYEHSKERIKDVIEKLYSKLDEEEINLKSQKS
jgi:hypothetical protein